jgi:hypothetical protein
LAALTAEQASLMAIDLIWKGTDFAHSGKLLSIPVLITIQLAFLPGSCKYLIVVL